METSNDIEQAGVEEIYSNEFDKMVDWLASARNEVRKKIMGIF